MRTSAPQDQKRKLDRSLVHGIAWTGGLKWLIQVFSWSATLIVARILTPSDYGLVGLATLYTGLIQLVNELGLGAAIVRRRDLTDEQITAIGGVSVAAGAVLWALSSAVAPFIAVFFGRWEVTAILTVLSITFLTSGIKVVPRALLSRDLQFKRVAAIDAIEGTVVVTVMLALALLGFRYWSLVLAMVCGSLASTATALVWRPHRVAWPERFDQIAGAVSFGSHIVVSRLAWYLYSNADFAVVGKALGAAALGAYNIGWTIASIPVDRISGMVSQVTPSIFSAVQNDPPALRRYVLRLTEALGFITFPISIGLATVTDDFVLVVLGEKWRAAIVPLQLLALYAGFRSITALFPHVLQAVGESRRAMNISLLALCVLPPMFYVGARWHGAVGVALAWVVGYPLVTLPMFLATLRVTEMRVRDYLTATWPPLFGCLIMAAAVLGVRHLMPGGSVSLRLALTVTAGALSYALVMYGIFRPRLLSWLSFAKELRR